MGLPARMARAGQRIAVNGREAYRSEAKGSTSLTWAESDLVIVLSADRLAFDGLLRMAESVGRRLPRRVWLRVPIKRRLLNDEKGLP